MPIYEYTCPRCGNNIEELKQIRDLSYPKCKECNVEMQKKISNTGCFILQGKGFYKNDYK